ncbi:cobaltochelatase subunit CobN [Runella slithyformis]|uniref:cobaltochelatase subunit CobN n=1 Tax=Runella slithyformis TaxID=106 RepID=UPI0002E065D8|nr:cobaltochelatase subunit CobN [Runella slithyformis]
MKKNNLSQIIGIGFVAVFIAFFGFVTWKSGLQPVSQKTILFVVGDNQAEAIVRATDRFYQQYPQLAQKVEVIVRTRSNTQPTDPVPPSDVMVVKVQEKEFFEQHLDYIKNTNTAFAPAGSPVVTIALGSAGAKYKEEDYEAFGMKRDPQVEAYHETPSPNEYRKMLGYLLNRYCGFGEVKIEKTAPLPENGLGIFQNGKVTRLVPTWQEWEQQQKPDPTKEKIGVLIYGSAAQEGILHIENAVGQEIERRGYQPVYVFGYPGSKAIKQTILDTLSWKNRGIKACISWLFKFSDRKAEKVLASLDVPLINAVDNFGNTLDEWKNSKKGLSSAEVAWQIAIPEIAGMVQPTVLGGVKLDGGIPYKTAIPERVERVVSRAIRYVKLQNTPASQRKVAILYWNYPPGKDNVGASYLNVMRTMPMLVGQMKKAGYTIQHFDPDKTRSIEMLIKERGRNVGKYAPGELLRMVNAGGAELIPVSTYKKWFAQLDPQYQLQITNHWGPPEKADIMTIRRNGELYFVLPIIRFGNVSIMPQPDRARSQDIAALYHSQTLPPHHQYICAYLWLQRSMDALIHTGTHGTQEWLDGKETGLSNQDSPEVLAGDLPIMYIYNMDVVGEGIQAKRRGAATIIDHLTPALGEAGMTPEMKKLNGLVRQWETTQSLNPEGTGPILEMIEQMATKMGIKKDLEKNGWGDKTALKAQKADKIKKMVEELQHYIEETRERSTPFGLHTFGVSPVGKQLDNFAGIIAKTNGQGRLSEFRTILSSTADEEIRLLLHGLEGRYVTPEVGNDPIRNPNAIPTGRNFYTFDPRSVPVPYADSIGRIMADNFVKDFKKNNGTFPQKVAFEVWCVETVRHQGMQEAQMLGLLGVRLVRDKMGRVENLELIPRSELGRPRVDVVMSSTGLYRDTFPMFFELMDKAFRLAASSPEADNPVRNHSEATRKKLIESGMDSAQARIRSQIRIFAEPSGTYGSKVSEAAYASGTWDNESQIAELYIRRMGNGYGGGIWGESMETEYKEALKGTQAIVHSRSSSLYMSLDNDDFFGFAGAIALGVRHLDKTKKSPSVMVADLRTKGSEKYQSLERFMGQELRSRYFNPEYIKAMTAEGYSGARHVMQGVEYLWGWQVVYPEVVTAEKWQEFYEVWLKDRYKLKTNEFFEEHSPHARESMSARMLEAVRKGYWNPSEEVKKDLSKIYVESVAKHGVSCGHTTCDHPELHQFIKGIAIASGSVKPADVAKWVKNVETATGKPIAEALAKRISDKNEWNDPNKVKQYKPNEAVSEQMAEKSQSSNQKQAVKGYKMQEEQVMDATSAKSSANAPTGSTRLYLGILGGQLVLLLLGGIRRCF